MGANPSYVGPRPSPNPGNLVDAQGPGQVYEQVLIAQGDQDRRDSGYDSGQGPNHNEGADMHNGPDQTDGPDTQIPSSQSSQDSYATVIYKPSQVENHNGPIEGQQCAPMKNKRGRPLGSGNRRKRPNHNATNEGSPQHLCDLVDFKSRILDGNYPTQYQDALDAVKHYTTEDTKGKPIDHCGSRTNSRTTREHLAAATEDGGRTSTECHQCRRLIEADRLEPQRHNFAKVRTMIMMKDDDDETAEPCIIDTFQFCTFQSDVKNKEKDLKDFGRISYWNDMYFYTDMIAAAEERIHIKFPFDQFRRANVTYTLEPAAISYISAKGIPYTEPVGQFTGTAKNIMKGMKKPVPLHVIAREDLKGIRKQMAFDACFTIIYLCTTDVKTATDIQITAKDDELTKRLKMITNDGSHTNLTTMAKIILAYADYQAKQQHKNPTLPYPTVQPIESTLDADLRKSLKKMEKLNKLKLKLQKGSPNPQKQVLLDNLEKDIMQNVQKLNDLHKQQCIEREKRTGASHDCMKDHEELNLSMGKPPKTPPKPLPRTFLQIKKEFPHDSPLDLSRIPEEAQSSHRQEWHTPAHHLMNWRHTLAERHRRAQERIVRQYSSHIGPLMSPGAPVVLPSSVNVGVPSHHRVGYNRDSWQPWMSGHITSNWPLRSHTAKSRPMGLIPPFPAYPPTPPPGFPNPVYKYKFLPRPQMMDTTTPRTHSPTLEPSRKRARTIDLE